MPKYYVTCGKCQRLSTEPNARQAAESAVRYWWRDRENSPPLEKLMYVSERGFIPEGTDVECDEDTVILLTTVVIEAVGIVWREG